MRWYVGLCGQDADWWLCSSVLLVLGYAVLSWVQPASPVHHVLGRPQTRPYSHLCVRLFLPLGGVDLSALVLMLMLQIGLMLVG
jgi:YggT family protein